MKKKFSKKVKQFFSFSFNNLLFFLSVASNNHSSKIETNPPTDTKQLPADIRLNMLTGVRTTRLSTSSTSTIGERSKDAIVRINELIRQNSVQDVEKKPYDDVFNDNDVLLTSNDIDKQTQISPIEFYINETNKLTNSIHEQTKETINITNLDDINIQQVKNNSMIDRLGMITYLSTQEMLFIFLENRSPGSYDRLKN
jgi:hypothetical protein